MVFLAQTKVIWSPVPDVDTYDAINARAQVLTTQGVTDGQKTREDQPDGSVAFTRNWTTVEAADEWVNFITTYGPHIAEVIEL